MKDAKGHGSDGNGGGSGPTEKQKDQQVVDNIRGWLGIKSAPAHQSGVEAARSTPSTALAAVAGNVMNRAKATPLKTTNLSKSLTPRVVGNKLVRPDGTVVARLHKSGSPAWR